MLMGPDHVFLRSSCTDEVSQFIYLSNLYIHDPFHSVSESGQFTIIPKPNNQVTNRLPANNQTERAPRTPQFNPQLHLFCCVLLIMLIFVVVVDDVVGFNSFLFGYFPVHHAELQSYKMDSHTL